MKKKQGCLYIQPRPWFNWRFCRYKNEMGVKYVWSQSKTLKTDQMHTAQIHMQKPPILCLKIQKGNCYE
jgi:hypothetical protein